MMKIRKSLQVSYEQFAQTWQPLLLVRRTNFPSIPDQMPFLFLFLFFLLVYLFFVFLLEVPPLSLFEKVVVLFSCYLAKDQAQDVMLKDLLLKGNHQKP